MQIDIEQLIETCIPGGSICDPRQIADNIRAYVAGKMERSVASDTSKETSLKWVDVYQAQNIPEGSVVLIRRPHLSVTKSTGLTVDVWFRPDWISVTLDHRNTLFAVLNDLPGVKED